MIQSSPPRDRLPTPVTVAFLDDALELVDYARSDIETLVAYWGIETVSAFLMAFANPGRFPGLRLEHAFHDYRYDRLSSPGRRVISPRKSSEAIPTYLVLTGVAIGREYLHVMCTGRKRRQTSAFGTIAECALCSGHLRDAGVVDDEVHVFDSNASANGLYLDNESPGVVGNIKNEPVLVGAGVKGVILRRRVRAGATLGKARCATIRVIRFE